MVIRINLKLCDPTVALTILWCALLAGLVVRRLADLSFDKLILILNLQGGDERVHTGLKGVGYGLLIIRWLVGLKAHWP